MTECVFCKIIEKEIPANVLYENQKAIAILDINPVSVGHTLIISKGHYENLLDAPVEILKEMIAVSKKVAKALMATTDSAGFNLLQSNNRAAGQVIPHIHFHIIPRKVGDGVGFRWETFKYKEGQMEEIADKIKKTLKG
jgi:histidine triad (HIT) family protein